MVTGVQTCALPIYNVGHLYEAKPALKQFYRKLDPTNSFNPGIGKTSKKNSITFSASPMLGNVAHIKQIALSEQILRISNSQILSVLIVS